MLSWYYKKDEVEVGPVSAEAILSLLRSAEVSPDQLVRREDWQDWLPISSVEKFDRRDEDSADHLHRFIDLPRDSKKPKTSSEKWVLLKKIVDEKETKFRQEGPFTTKQIMRKVVLGEAEFTDYVWKPGLDSWSRIGATPEFDRRSHKVSEEKVDGDTVTQTFPDLVVKSLRQGITKATTRFLNTVITEVKQDLQRSALEDSIPPEAEGVDLLKIPVSSDIRFFDEEVTDESMMMNGLQDLAPPTEKMVRVEKPAAVEKVSEAVVEEKIIEKTEEKKAEKKKKRGREKSRKNKKVRDDELVVREVGERNRKAVHPRKRQQKLRAIRRTQFLVALTMIAAIFVLGFAIHRHFQKQIIQKKASNPAPSQNVSQRRDTEVALVKDPSIKLIERQIESNSPKLIIKTNAAAGQKVYVTVTGLFGQIVGALSFKKSVTLTKESGENLVFEFKDISSPQGQVKVLVESANSSKEADYFLGKNDSVYASALNRQLKLNSYQYQRERKQLYYLTQTHIVRLNRLIKEMKTNPSGKKWNSFFRSWSADVDKTTTKELLSFSDSQWGQYALPHFWSELKALRRETEQTTGQLARLKGAMSKHVSQPNFVVLLANWRDFRRKLSELSLRKSI